MALKPIYLEPDEEITSVVDKIKAADSRQVAVVVPKNGTIFQSLVNLKLLAREAKTADKTVVLISANKVGTRLARQVGIETYSTLGNVTDSPAPTAPATIPTSPLPETIDGIRVHRYEGATTPTETSAEPEPAVEPVDKVDNEPAEEESPVDDHQVEPEVVPPVEPKTEPAPEKEVEAPTALPPIVSRGVSRSSLTMPKIKIPWKSVLAAVAIVLVGILITVLFLPRGEVTLSFAAKPIDKTVTLQAKTVDDGGDATVVGNLLQSSKDGTKVVTATGKKDIGTKATGTLTFYNKASSSPVTLAAGTTVTYSGKSFTTDKSISIPGASVSGGNIVPGQTTGSVTATVAGDTYNLSGVQFTIAGQPTTVYANGSTSGGTTKQVTVLSQTDVDQGYADLKTQLTTDTTTDLKAKADKQTLLDGATKVGVVSQSIDKKVGDQVDSATASMSVTASAIVFDSATAVTKLKAAMSKDLLDTEQLVIPDANVPSLVFKGLSDDKTVMTFDATGAGFAAPKIDKSVVAKSVANKSFGQAESFLKDQYKATSVEIKVTPSWWLKRLPLLSKAIVVNYGFVENQTNAVPGT